MGKSKVAQLLCEEHGNCEVVIADSVQIYKHLDIGSNKPSIEERESVPHHLVDICEPHEIYSSGEFVKSAVPVIYDILNRCKVPIVVGGSTMYLQWLVQGTPDAPKASKAIEEKAESLLREAEHAGKWDQAKEILSKYDPLRAASLGRNDWYRMRRYLEVALSVEKDGRVAGEGGRIPNFPDLDLRCYFLSEDREQLYRMIDYRCEAMLKMGLIDEVVNLVRAEQLTPMTTAAKAIGYRQTLEYLGEEIAREEDEDVNAPSVAFRRYLANFATATRNYAKRQLQWYRKDMSFLWLRIERPDAVASKTTEEEPYRQVAREILHWNGLPASNYRQMIKHQVQKGSAVAAVRSKLTKYKSRMKVDGEMEWLAVAALVAKGELQPPAASPNSGDNTWGAQFTSIKASGDDGDTIKEGEDDEEDEDELERMILTGRSVTGAAPAHSTGVDVDVDDDEAVERVAMTMGGGGISSSDSSGSTLPRTLPSFPTDYRFDWSAEEPTIRGAESVKGGKASMKMKAYIKKDEMDFDEVIATARGYISELRESHPYLLTDFFPTEDSPNRGKI